MDFSFKPELTKDFILKHITEEQIMGFYLHMDIRSKKLFRSPLRKDNNPTCSIFRNKSGTLIFKDFATGQYLNCFEIVKTIFNCEYHQALKIIANDFGLIKDNTITKNKGKIISKDVKVEEKEFAKIQVEIQEFTDSELKWWARYGITKDILEAFDIYSCKHVFLNGQLIAKSQQNCPIFGYYGKKYHGEELWKIYAPKSKSMKWMSNWPSSKIQGYDQLPKKGKLCVLTKSLKDVATLYSLGIAACAPNSENVLPSKAIIDDLTTRFNYVIALWDNDLPGISNLNKLHKLYPNLICTFIPRRLGAKDISDLRKLVGENKTKHLIKDYLIWLKNEVLD